MSLAEDDTRTEATAQVTIEDAEYRGSGIAKRNPNDPNVPTIGEELATARALSDLSHKLVEAAAGMLEEHIGRPATLEE